jgi:hypothetical protein
MKPNPLDSLNHLTLPLILDIKITFTLKNDTNAVSVTSTTIVGPFVQRIFDKK